MDCKDIPTPKNVSNNVYKIDAEIIKVAAIMLISMTRVGKVNPCQAGVFPLPER